MDEIAAVEAADEAGFKYVWVTEHHFLDEYSHLSANDVVSGYLAHATERIHIGSGIFNPLPQVNHPAKVAERVAMLDHLSEGRFEFGTGRGAGSHEILGFLPEGMTDTSATRRDLGGRHRRVRQDVDAGRRTRATKASTGRCRRARSCRSRTRSRTRRCGTPPATRRATRWRRSKGLGVLGFSVQAIDEMGPVVEAYKNAIASAEPVGAYVNDNVMITTAAYVR